MTASPRNPGSLLRHTPECLIFFSQCNPKWDLALGGFGGHLAGAFPRRAEARCSSRCTPVAPNSTCPVLPTTP
eukprot:321045-Rhodomonas_salina.1